MSITRRFAAVAAGFALAAAAVLIIAPAASAHDSLVDGNPADSEVVTVPISDVSLRFSGVLLGVDTGANIAVVTGPDGAYYDTDCAAVDGTTLTLPIALGEPGTYQVQWRVVSSDGHPISGQYAFTYQPPAGTGAATGSDASPCAGTNAAPEPAAENPGASTGLVWGVGIGAISILLIAGIVLLIVRPWRKAPTTPDAK